jgi:hypothetical protein
LLLLGLVLPLLLMLLIAPLASEAMYDAVSTARRDLTRRALESDTLTVNLLASSLERELVDRREELLQIAEDDVFRSRVEEYASLPQMERKKFMEELDEEYEKNQARRQELGRSEDASWFLLDAKGIQRWHQPPTETLDGDFSWRDYFNGREKTYTAKTAPKNLTPIRAPRISRVYFSTSRKRFRVAVSVPIWDKPRENVIGVLARSIYLGDLLLDYEESVKSQGADGVGRVLALIDSRDWKLIAHSEWRSDDTAAKWESEELDRLVISSDLREDLQPLLNDPATATSDRLDRVSDYIDPLSEIRPEEYGGTWLAAFCRVGKTGWADTGWIAVVQERRAAAFKAVDELRTRMWLFGISAVAIVVVLVAGCWWLIVRIVNERPLRWWPWGRAGGNWPTAATLTWTSRGTNRV